MSEEFEKKVHREFNLIHRQLADHGQMLSELKVGQKKLEVGQQQLEGKIETIELEVSSIRSEVSSIRSEISSIKSDIGELRADMIMMDSKLTYLCDFIRRQIQDEDDD